MIGETPVPRRQGPIWVGTALLLALTLLFMGRVLFPPPGQAVGGWDMQGGIYPILATTRDALYEGRLPLWDPYHFSGYPFIGKPQVSVFYPPTWLAYLLPVNIGISLYVVFHVWMAGIGMLLLVRHIHRSWLASLLAAVTFSFSGFVAARIYAGHVGPLAAYSWIPWLLLGFRWSVEREDVWSAVIGGLPFALAILSGHLPSVLYIALIWGSFIIYTMLSFSTRHEARLLNKPIRWLIIRQAAIMSIMGLCLSAVQLIPVIEMALISTRVTNASFEFATTISMPPIQLITLLIPEYFGEPTRVGYWGAPRFEELTYYAGTLPFVGLTLALRKPTRRTWHYIGLIVLGFLLALGSYGFLYEIAYRLLPPFRLVRVPGRAVLLFVVAASMLLADTVAQWESTLEEKTSIDSYLSRVMIGLAVMGTAGLVATGAIFAAWHPTDMSGRLWHQIGGWALAMFFSLAGGGLLWGYLGTARQHKGRCSACAVGLVALLVTDLWVFGFKLVQLTSLDPAPVWTDAQQIIGETDERVLPWGFWLFDQNEAGLVGLRSVFGYNPIKVESVMAFATSVPDPRSTAYDILGVGYVLAPVELEGYFDGERPLELIDSTDSVWVYHRARVLPLARLAYWVEVIGDANAAIDRVHEPDFDPVTTVILDQQPPCDVGPVPRTTGLVEVVEEQPGTWLIDVESDAPGLLVLSETAYPGWKVTVDGERAKVLTAYTAVRAVCVPAGAHRVEWIFDPLSLKIGAAVTVIALAVGGVALWRSHTTGRRITGDNKDE